MADVPKPPQSAGDRGERSSFLCQERGLLHVPQTGRSSVSGRILPQMAGTSSPFPFFFFFRYVLFTCFFLSSFLFSFLLSSKSFRTMDEMEERVKDFSSLVAFKFDFGAIYSIPVSEKETFHTAFKPEQKVCVFLS